MKKPTFFLSSTIYDFADLRSAIKFFLEEQGCNVLASEYNDFKKSLDRHSYDACIEAIRQADYFILLIGSRVGGWTDKNKTISITRQEYREAYKLAQQGSLKIVIFVRQDIWNLRSDRIELSKYLKNLDLKESEQESIVNHPSKRANNPKFISDFISEVSRNEETKSAISGDTSFPINNWIHTFSTFREIFEVLNTEIFNNLPIEEATQRKLLLTEVKEILRESLSKMAPNAVFSPKSSILFLYQEHNITKDLLNSGTIIINKKRWEMLSSYAIHTLGMNLKTLILPQALTSSTFLQFSTKTNTFEELPIFKKLKSLYEEIETFRKIKTNDNLSIIFDYSPKNLAESYENVDLDRHRFLMLLSLLQRWSNIIELSKSVILFLEDEKHYAPQIFHKSPIFEVNEQLKNETVTDSELDDFIYKTQ